MTKPTKNRTILLCLGPAEKSWRSTCGKQWLKLRSYHRISIHFMKVAVSYIYLYKIIGLTTIYSLAISCHFRYLTWRYCTYSYKQSFARMSPYMAPLYRRYLQYKGACWYLLITALGAIHQNKNATSRVCSWSILPRNLLIKQNQLFPIRVNK